MLISWVSAAWTAAVKPPGMGLWRPMKPTWDTPGSISSALHGIKKGHHIIGGCCENIF